MKKFGKALLWALGGLMAVTVASAAFNPSPPATDVTTTAPAVENVVQQEAAPEEPADIAPAPQIEPEAIPAPLPTYVADPTPTVAPAAAPAPVVDPTPTVVALPPATTTTTDTTTYDTYTNVDGNTVQSPTYYDSAPPDATAQCNDGTYSFSQHHSGTCSGHKGVATWL